MPAKPTDNDRLLTALAAVDQIQREQAETNDLLNQDEQDRQNFSVQRLVLLSVDFLFSSAHSWRRHPTLVAAEGCVV